MDKIIIEKGTTIHIDGFPFKLNNDTVVLGNKNNMELSSKIKLFDGNATFKG